VCSPGPTALRQSAKRNARKAGRLHLRYTTLAVGDFDGRYFGMNTALRDRSHRHCRLHQDPRNLVDAKSPVPLLWPLIGSAEMALFMYAFIDSSNQSDRHTSPLIASPSQDSQTSEAHYNGQHPSCRQTRARRTVTRECPLRSRSTSRRPNTAGLHRRAHVRRLRCHPILDRLTVRGASRPRLHGKRAHLENDRHWITPQRWRPHFKA
jgi:hypothetical protein